MKRLLVTIPTDPSHQYVHRTVAAAVVRLSRDWRYAMRIEFPSQKPFENSLHHTINDFMANGDDYWLSIDADNPPRRNPLDLIAFDKDVMCLPTPVWHFDPVNPEPGKRPTYLNTLRREADGFKEWRDKNGLQKIDGFGTGCFIIARRVFEDPEMRKAPFQRTYNPDGTVEYGNDYAFSDRARRRNWEMWAHFDYICDHHCELSLSDVGKAFVSWADGSR